LFSDPCLDLKSLNRNDDGYKLSFSIANTFSRGANNVRYWMLWFLAHCPVSLLKKDYDRHLKASSAIYMNAQTGSCDFSCNLAFDRQHASAKKYYAML